MLNVAINSAHILDPTKPESTLCEAAKNHPILVAYLVVFGVKRRQICRQEIDERIIKFDIKKRR